MVIFVLIRAKRNQWPLLHPPCQAKARGTTAHTAKTNHRCRGSPVPQQIASVLLTFGAFTTGDWLLQEVVVAQALWHFLKLSDFSFGVQYLRLTASHLSCEKDHGEG